MTMSGLLSFLEERLPGKFQINAPMERYTTFRVGGPADLLVEPETREEVCSLLREIHTQQVPLTVIGNGSNLLVLDKGIRGCVVKLGSCLKQLTIQGCTIRVEAGVLLSRLASAAAEGGLAGLEFASGIPGSLGGAILMNAGAYGGEIGNLVRSVTVADGGGELRTLNREEMEFRYRHSAVMDSGDIILGATLELTRDDPDAIRERISELTRRRVSKQPLNFPSAGSTFKRPPGYFAAALIDQAGLRGYRVGDAQVSEKHTGFVVNRGHATASEILQLMDDVREKVHAMSGVWLEPEVRIIGEK
ncbi:UDP-N-acetylmuramate dehydrogenase [Acidaminococcus fermentans]